MLYRRLLQAFLMTVMLFFNGLVRVLAIRQKRKNTLLFYRA